LVAGALVAIAVHCFGRPHGLDNALVRFDLTAGESAVVEPAIVGPVIELVLPLAVWLVGVWVPIAVAIVITSAV